MSADWDASNAAFLARALSWLRGRMLAETGEKPREAATPEPEWSPEWSPEGLQPAPALLLLRERFGLSVFETKILLLCAGADLDPAIAPLCARLQGGERANPSFALCLRLFADANWEALSPHQPLRAWRLVNCTAAHGTLIGAALHADERVVHFIKGLNEIDTRLLAWLVAGPAAAVAGEALPASQEVAAAALARTWKEAERPLVVLTGIDPASKRLVASVAAERLGLLLCRSTPDLLPGAPAEIELFQHLWRREQMLLPLALLIDDDDCGDAAPGEFGLRRLLLRLDGPLALCAQDAPGIGRPVQCIAVAKPTRSEQEGLWRAALGEAQAEMAASLAAHFALSAPAIAAIAARGPAGLWHACRETLRLRLDRLAQRIEARATWDDIVVPAERGALLLQIVSQVRNRRRIHDEWGFAARSGRGLGISALFAGESGTGKTLAAEVLASSLGLDLYRIDLSGVVSKYIGETEKNLRRLFDAAEESGAILFFDEADALFGKRSEVRDSHDRYANIEVNYLLQRIEAYRGLAILATNLRSALDPAFLRRLRFVVTFPYPGPAERQAIWHRAFPVAAKLGVLDWVQLGLLNLTGGNIATVALNAAFLAGAEDGAVQMRHVLAAARAEYVKLDRPFREADFLAAVPRDVAERVE